MTINGSVLERINEELEEQRKVIAEVSKGNTSAALRKNLQKPDFTENSVLGGVVNPGEADSVIAQLQDARYGTPFTGKGKGGDFSNKIVIGVGFLNEQKTDGDVIDLSDPNLRYGAGITIYQRTDVGKPNTFLRDIGGESGSNTEERQKRTERMATTPTPQKAISLLDMTGDVVQIKGRQQVNIISGYDFSIPNYGTSKNERNNTDYLGVNLIGGGNPSDEELRNTSGEFGLQSIPRGENLQEALQQIGNRINENAKILGKVIRGIAILESTLLAHTHVVQAGPFPGIAPPSIDFAIGSSVRIPALIKTALSSLTQVYNSTAQKVNMSVVSKGYINSRWNKTN